MSGFVVFICGLVIALALYLLLLSLHRISRGGCCEGCGGCSQRDNCSNGPGGGKDTARGVKKAGRNL